MARQDWHCSHSSHSPPATPPLARLELHQMVTPLSLSSSYGLLGLFSQWVLWSSINFGHWPSSFCLENALDDSLSSSDVISSIENLCPIHLLLNHIIRCSFACYLLWACQRLRLAKKQFYSTAAWDSPCLLPTSDFAFALERSCFTHFDFTYFLSTAY